MTAGLVSAALETDGVELQLVTGSRADLIKVRSGMEAVTRANVERVRLERAIRPYMEAWRRYAYAEAHQGLAACLDRATERWRPGWHCYATWAVAWMPGTGSSTARRGICWTRTGPASARVGRPCWRRSSG